MSFSLNFHAMAAGYNVAVNRFTTFVSVQMATKDGDVNLFLRDGHAAMDLGQAILKAAAGVLAKDKKCDDNGYIGSVPGGTIRGQHASETTTDAGEANVGSECGVADNTHCD